MTDTMTPEQRHRCMSHIRSKDTKPELKVRRVKGRVKGTPRDWGQVPVIRLL